MTGSRVVIKRLGTIFDGLKGTIEEVDNAGVSVKVRFDEKPASCNSACAWFIKGQFDFLFKEVA